MTQGRPKGRYTQAGRIHTVIRLIETRKGVSTEELADELRVSKRTIYRDLTRIEEAGYPLVSENTDDGPRYSFMTQFHTPQAITFSLEELLSLHILQGLSAQLPEGVFRKDLTNIIQKVHASLPPRSVAHLERITSVALPRFQGVSIKAPDYELQEVIRKALLLQYQLIIQYKKGQQPLQDYTLDPYALVLARGGLYLLGFAHNRQATRLFALDRIVSASIQKCRFEIPAEFQAQACFNDAFGLVSEASYLITIRFSGDIAHLVEDKLWHPGQQCIRQPDGSLLLTFTSSGTLEIISWVLSFGRHAELLEPPLLRRELALHAFELNQRYRQKNT